MDKKGFELSINMIVITILAIMALGVGLAFISTMGGKINDFAGKDWPSIDTAPTADKPLVFAPSTFTRGADNKMSVAFYNNEEAEISSSILPEIICTDLDLSLKSAGLTIPTGKSASYKLIVTLSKDAKAGSYACTLKISNSQESFFLDIK